MKIKARPAMSQRAARYKIRNTTYEIQATSYKAARAAKRQNERAAVDALPLGAMAPPLGAHPPLVISINLPEHTHMSSYRRMVPYMHGVICRCTGRNYPRWLFENKKNYIGTNNI